MKTEIINKVVEALKVKVYRFETDFTYKVDEEEGSITIYPSREEFVGHHIGNLQWFGEVCTFFDVILSVGIEYLSNRMYIIIH